MRLILVATILGSSMVFIDATVVNVALQPIQHDLGGGLSAQQWVVDAYLLTLGSLILVGGSLGDIFGEIRLFTIGVAAFGASSILCAVAPDVTTLIVFRGIQGVAGALLTPASLALITSTFSGAERGAAIGTWAAWSGISTVVGPPRTRESMSGARTSTPAIATPASTTIQATPIGARRRHHRHAAMAANPTNSHQSSARAGDRPSARRPLNATAPATAAARVDKISTSAHRGADTRVSHVDRGLRMMPRRRDGSVTQPPDTVAVQFCSLYLNYRG